MSSSSDKKPPLPSEAVSHRLESGNSNRQINENDRRPFPPIGHAYSMPHILSEIHHENKDMQDLRIMQQEASNEAKASDIREEHVSQNLVSKGKRKLRQIDEEAQYDMEGDGDEYHEEDDEDDSNSQWSLSQRRGRKNHNLSSDERRERNRQAVRKFRQRQQLKYNALQATAEKLERENVELEALLQAQLGRPTRNALTDTERTLLINSMQMGSLMKMKQIFTQGLPKELVAHADSLWTPSAVLSASMPSRCYIGIERIRSYWKSSLRMKNKGRIHSFWAWIFALPPSERFTEFSINRHPPTAQYSSMSPSQNSKSNLYCIHWTTNSTPSFTGQIFLHFGNDHRVVFHVESFGWLIWKYLITHKPFPLIDHSP